MSCCSIPLNLRDVVRILSDGPTKTALSEHERDFNKKDTRSLYFTTLTMFVNVIVLLFVIAGFDQTHQTRKLISVECVFMICYTLANALIRIWILKFYMLQPVLSSRQHFNDVIADKWMFFWSVFFGFAGVVLMIGVIASLFKETYVLSIILTCVTCVIFILCTLFYRLHVGVYIGKLTDVSASTSSNV